MAFGMSKRSWTRVAKNVSIIAGILFLMMVIAPTHHDRTPIFSEDGKFQVTSPEMVKHFKMSKWKMPPHELLDVKAFYDYIENPPSSCGAYAYLGGRACHEIEDHMVCLDPSLGLDHDNCLVYSFGASSKSFEKAMTNLGCNVYMFDPASHRADHRRSDRSWLYRIRLAGNDSAALPGDKVMTLDEVLYAFGHRSRQLDFLLLDLDGEEWPALRRMMSTRVLDDVRQLGVQTVLDVEELAPRQRLERLRQLYQVLVGLEHSGLRLVSSRRQVEQVSCHGLPELGDERKVCSMYELVFVRR
ncbi:methyltransferase-like protein 24 [Pollicipes pollicipes]|uniref:methyltransferase-like protein 24 n=1 Tax=Pollicipes pollicipes TaxID=41117 RepID=UPI0018858E12|nr:methyltransferase-like protein 24 [Pollicipes pollicipes]